MPTVLQVVSLLLDTATVAVFEYMATISKQRVIVTSVLSLVAVLYALACYSFEISVMSSAFVLLVALPVSLMCTPVVSWLMQWQTSPRP